MTEILKKNDPESTLSPDGPTAELSGHSIRGDWKRLHNEFQAEKNGNSPSPNSTRFSLPVTFFFFWGYSAVIFSVITPIHCAFYPNYRWEAAVWAGLVIFLAGHFLIAGTFYCKKKFGALTEMGFGLVVRTGIPLMAVLVFYFAIDKILFKMTVLTMVVFYMAALPFEVWVFLPKSKKGTNGTGKNERNDDVGPFTNEG